MKEKFLYHNNISIYAIILFLLINDTIKISTSETINSQKLNSKIFIGPSCFANINLVSFTNGALIVESSSDLGSNERYFYGITKEGKPYFENNKYILSLHSQSGIYRRKSENFVITINDQTHSEYLVSFGYDTKVEIYDLNEKQNITIESFFGNEAMNILRQTGINYYDGEYYYFIYGYISSDYTFNLKKLIFSSLNLNEVITIETKIEKSITEKPAKAASCYITENNYIGCIVVIKNTQYISNLFLYIYDINLDKQLNIDLDGYSIFSETLEIPYFIKCIHLKGEIGVFSFYRSSNGFMLKNPVLLVKEYRNRITYDYISPIILDKMEFCMDNLLNDLIKINENKLCFLSTSESKEEMYIVLINIYGDRNVVIRYYFFNIFSLYTFKFYKNIRANLYNNYIAFAFSFCLTKNCSSIADEHYPGFMIFNYPNGTDYNQDLIDLMFSNNELIYNYSFNLYNYIWIDNNIFGLKTSNIKIKEINCETITLLNGIGTDNFIISERESIIAKINSFKKAECSISYLYLITEPEFEKYNSYPDFYVFSDTYNENYFTKEIYESRLLYYNIYISEDLSEECSDENCLLCKNSDKIFCIICRFNYIIKQNENGNYKICTKEKSSVSPILISFEAKEKEEEKEKEVEKEEKEEEKVFSNSQKYKNDVDIIIYGSSINYVSSYSNLTFHEIYNKIKDNIIPFYCFNCSSVYIAGNNRSSFQVSNTNNELITLKEGNGISPIDLGECENILKDFYNIEKDTSLIILKTLITEEYDVELTSQFEVFHPFTYEKLNLSYCDNVTINAFVPLILNQQLKEMYTDLLFQGYNLFDINDPFYADVCTPYKSENSTDILLDDRKEFIYSSLINVTSCPGDCIFSKYNLDVKFIECECNNNNNNNKDKLDLFHISGKKIYNSFLNTLKSSNCLVIKCFNLVFNLKVFYHNYGSIISSILFIIYICFMIYSIFKNITPIKSNISKLVINEFEKNTDKSNSKNNLGKNHYKDLNLKGHPQYPPIKRLSKKSKSKRSVNVITHKKDFTNSHERIKISKNSKKLIRPYTKASIGKDIHSNISINDKNKKSGDLSKKEKKLNNKKTLDNYELNNLDYDEACDLDNRSFLATYWSILLREHLFMNTFFACDDYNLFYIKFEKFLILFFTDMAMNGLFFVHESMHNIYVEGIEFSFIQKIPQLVFTVIVNKILETILCFFSLTDVYIYQIKDLLKDNNNKKVITDILKCIKRKLVAFFIFTFLLFLFYWYFVSSFCAVYQNTQMIFLKDTIISFITSSIETFFLYGFTTFLRVISLSSYCKKQYFSGCLYKISDIFPIF